MADKCHIDVAKTTVRLCPDPHAEASNELLYGEAIHILEERGDWYKIRSEHDGYEGFVLKSDLRTETEDANHYITALWGHIYAEPDFKSPARYALPFMAQIQVTGTPEGLYLPTSLGWAIENQTSERILPSAGSDVIQTALRFMGTPYLWGGRTAQGIDCSGLVQIAFMAAGIPCPRDTHQQIELGQEVSRDQIRSNDLVFFERHVGIMVDEHNILNATSRTMDVRIEKLDDLEKIYNGIISIKRLNNHSP